MFLNCLRFWEANCAFLFEKCSMNKVTYYILLNIFGKFSSKQLTDNTSQGPEVKFPKGKWSLPCRLNAARTSCLSCFLLWCWGWKMLEMEQFRQSPLSDIWFRAGTLQMVPNEWCLIQNRNITDSLLWVMFHSEQEHYRQSPMSDVWFRAGA